MSENQTSIELKIGNFSFSGNGREEWISEQLDKILYKAEEIIEITQKSAPEQSGFANQNIPNTDNITDDENSLISSKALPKFLTEKNANKVQTLKFLATSIWLHAKGQNRLTTREISTALKNANQTKINNPSDCLNKNISKGLCEKDGNQFFVTEDGRRALGL